jgi:hypothetical protein
VAQLSASQITRRLQVVSNQLASHYMREPLGFALPPPLIEGTEDKHWQCAALTQVSAGARKQSQ